MSYRRLLVTDPLKTEASQNVREGLSNMFFSSNIGSINLKKGNRQKHR